MEKMIREYQEYNAKKSAFAAMISDIVSQDDFKKAFPSAKWDSVGRSWKVGPRSLKRLESWIAEVEKSGIIEQLDELETAELKAREIAELNVKLEQIRKETAQEIAAKKAAVLSKQEYDALILKLDEAKDSLDAARKEKRDAEADANAAQIEIEKRVSHITTRSKIAILRSVMLKNFIPKAYARRAFNEAQEELREIDDKLEEIGVYCDALRRAVNANHNRPDRDKSDLFGPIFFEKDE